MDLSILSFKLQADIKLTPEEALKLQAGDVVRGVIQSITSEGMVRLLVRGKSVLAEAQVPVQAGQELYLQVDRLENGKLYMRVVDPESQAELPDLALRGILTKIGLKGDELTSTIARKLIAYNLPVTKENVEAVVKMADLVQQNKARVIEAAVYVLSRGSRINEADTLDSLVRFFSSPVSREQLSQSMKRLLSPSANNEAENNSNRPPNVSDTKKVSWEQSYRTMEVNNLTNRSGEAPAGKVTVSQQSPKGNNEAVPPNKGSNSQTSSVPEANIRFESVQSPASRDGINTQPLPASAGKNTALPAATNHRLNETVKTILANVATNPVKADADLNTAQPGTTNATAANITSSSSKAKAVLNSPQTTAAAVNLDRILPQNINPAAGRILDADIMPSGPANPEAKTTMAQPSVGARIGSTANNMVPANSSQPQAAAVINSASTNTAAMAVLTMPTDNKVNQVTRQIADIIRPALEAIIINLDQDRPDGNQVKQVIKEQQTLLPEIKYAGQLLEQAGEGTNNPLRAALDLLEQEWKGQSLYNRLEQTGVREQSNFYITLPVRWQGEIENAEISINWRRNNHNSNSNPPEYLTVNVGLNTVNMGTVIFHMRTQAKQLSISAYLESEDAKSQLDQEIAGLVEQLNKLGFDTTFMGSQLVSTLTLRPEFVDALDQENLPPVTGLDLKV